MRFALVLSLLLVPTLARAADAPPPADDAAVEERRARAKSRYEEGAAAYSAGRFKDAVDLFLEADSLAPSAPLSFNIARAYEKLGDDAGALRWFRDYLRRAPDAPNAKEVDGSITAYEQRLAKKGVQQLTVISTPVGATVAIDDRPVGVTPWTGELPPGPHRVGFTMRGFDDASLEITLSANRSQDFAIRLVPKSDTGAPAAPVAAAPQAAPQPSEKRDEEPSKGLGIWPWVTLGAGGVALGGALTFELLRRSSESAAEKENTQIGYQEKLDQMESRQTTARILAGVGGALVIAGGVLVVVDQSSSKGSKAASLAVTPTPGGLFVAARGAY